MRPFSGQKGAEKSHNLHESNACKASKNFRNIPGETHTGHTWHEQGVPGRLPRAQPCRVVPCSGPTAVPCH